jgi:hypothetical protein
MKRIYLLLLLLPVFAGAQVTQYSAPRIIATDSFRLRDQWIRKITTDLNTSDSNSHNMLPTARAVMDAINRKGGGGGGAAAWGSITGTLSSQTDLLNALNLRLLKTDTANMLLNYVNLPGWGINKVGKTVSVDTTRGIGVPTYPYVDSLNRVMDNRVRILENSSWYLDGNSGNDVNDGRTPGRALKTVAALLAKPIQPNDKVLVARNTTYREFLNLSTIDSLTVQDYGTGLLPVFDAADTASNHLFTKTGGFTNLYQVSWTNAFRDNTDISQYSVWENGTRLIRAVSQAACDATPGSYYVAAVTQPAGTDVVYIHSINNSSVVTNGKLYEITRRPQGIQVRDFGRVINMHTKRNGSNNGSIETRHNAYVEGVIAEDGVKHNFFMASGAAVNCVAWKCDSAFAGGTTMFVSFTISAGADTMDVLYKNCIAIAGKNNDAFSSATIVGLYMHTGGPSAYRSCTVDGGYYINCAYGVDGEPGTMTVKNAQFYRNSTAISKVANGTINVLNNVFVDNRYAVNANPTTLNFHQNKIRMINVIGDERVIKGFIDTASVTYNTLYNDDFTNAYFTENNGGGIKYNFKHNLFTGPITTASIALLSTSQASTDNKVHADSNYYYYGIYVFSDGSKTVAQMQALSPAQEVNSGILIPESIFTGGLDNGDFFVSKSDTLFGKGGSNSTYDSLYRFAYNLFDFHSQTGDGDELSRSLRTKADLDQPNNLLPVIATNTQNLYVYKDLFFLNKDSSGAAAPHALYIDPATNQLKVGTLNSGNTIYSGNGTLSGNRQVAGDGKRLELGTVLSRMSRFDFRGDSAFIATSTGPLYLSGKVVFDYGAADGTANVGLSNNFFELAILSTARTVNFSGLASSANYPYQVELINKNNTANLWTLATTVTDLFGNTVTEIPNEAISRFHYTGSNWILKSVSNRAIVRTDAGSVAAFQFDTDYSFFGTTTTFTLPPLANNKGRTYTLKNMGSGNVTVNSNAGGNDLYDNAAVNTYPLTPGQSITIRHNGNTYTINY